MFERQNALVVMMAAPGTEVEDLHVGVTGNTLSVTGHRLTEQEVDMVIHVHRERLREPFHQEVVLPDGLAPHQAKAGFRGGIVTITIPKAEAIKEKL
jgi:HSP20 family protein